MHASPPPADYRGRAFVYVLASAGAEDLLKVGLTHDPLARWSAFHPRWFEVFDLEHSLLVETESRADAQALETTLHRALAAHRCPAPLTIRLAAGGAGEWYRGAYPRLWRLAGELEAGGHVVHRRAFPWLQAAMRQRQDGLHALVRQACDEHACGWLDAPRRRAVLDLVDAHRCFDAGIDARVPADYARLHGPPG